MAAFDMVQEKLNVFTEGFQSLVISSQTDKDEPYASYAPFVKVDDAYFFLISKIAKHYKNMLHHPIISIMFLEDESTASNIFFRKRLSYLAHTYFIEDDIVKQAFIDKFGGVVKRLFDMDFIMVKCEIMRGKFVVGAGKAYEVDQHQHIIHEMTGSHGYQAKS